MSPFGISATDSKVGKKCILHPPSCKASKIAKKRTVPIIATSKPKLSVLELIRPSDFPPQEKELFKWGEKWRKKLHLHCYKIKKKQNRKYTLWLVSKKSKVGWQKSTTKKLNDFHWNGNTFGINSKIAFRVTDSYFYKKHNKSGIILKKNALNI